MSLNTFNIIHIVVEVVTLLSITAYFLHQNSKIMSRIDNLNNTIEEYEEKIGEQDKKINGILKSLKKIESKIESGSSNKEKEKDKTKEDSGDGSVCIDGVCSLPPSFGGGFQIPLMPSPFKHFFEKQQPFFSQVQEIIVEEKDEDFYDEEEDVVKVTSYEDDDDDDVPEDVIIEIEKEKKEVKVASPKPVTPPPKIEEHNDVTLKKKKRKRKKNSVSSVPDLDKELEDELNELNAL